MKRFIIVLLLITLVFGTLAGCGKTAQSGSGEPQNTPSKSAEPGKPEDLSQQAPYTVKLMFPGKYSKEDCDKVAELASAITAPKFNTKFDVVRSDFGTYKDDINMILASNEKLDLFFQYQDTFTASVNNGQLVEIGQYFDKYAPEMKSQISDVDWSCVTVDKGIYAMPANKEKAFAWGFVVVKKIADSLGVDYSKIKTEEDLVPFLEAMKAKYPEFPPLSSNGGTMDTMTTMDDLGDGFGVLENCTDSNNRTVVNWYATDTFKKAVERRYEWVKKGLIAPDSVTITDSWADLVMAGKAYSRFTNFKPGIMEEIVKRTQGIEMVVIPLTETYSTSSALNILWSVAHNSEKPERTVQIMNEIYTNPELQNILCNGIEGRHWEYKNAEKTLVGYPKDMDSQTGLTYRSYTWAWMNEMITPVWEPAGVTLWKDTDEFNKKAINSPAKGFLWSNVDVMNEITACTVVRDKYKKALECGSINPAEALPKFLKELEDAGINNIIQEKQKQLDAWFANK